MRIAELQGGPKIDEVYESILVPSFPPDELCTVDVLQSGLAAGTTSVTVIENADGRPVAAAVGEWSERSRVQLLSYLAAVQDSRGAGYGGRLLDHVLGQWREQWKPCAILAEVHHPSTPLEAEAYGDSAARVRFYDRHGGRALDVPYFQPALAPTLSRQYDLLLLALHLDPQLTVDSPEVCASWVLHEFMTEYLESTEGSVAEDSATRALFAAIDRAPGVGTLPLTSPDLPRSRPPA